MKLVGYYIFAVLLGLGTPVLAEQALQEIEQGVHYKKLAVAVKTRDADKIEVVEVFSYGCVHCFDFDPEVESWVASQSDDVDFRRVPAIFNKSWEALAQAFFTAEILGVTDKVHTPIFHSIHRGGADLRERAQMAQLFKNIAGIDEIEFTKIYNSFGVRSQVQQANAEGRMYRITGVPTLVVAGKYVIEGRMAGSNSRMLEVAGHLIQQERNLQASSPDGD